jgi:ribonuclease HI
MSPSNKIAPPGSARLFADSQPLAPAAVHIANIDGASRGNPGPASYAVILRDPTGRIVLELAKNIGRETNNVAEYFALLAALDYAVGHNITALRIRSDSELLVRQMQGRYKVKSADLKPLHERAAKLARQLQYFVIEHVRREQNRDADALANVALDSAGLPKFADRQSPDRPSQDRPSQDRKSPVDSPRAGAAHAAKDASSQLPPAEPTDSAAPAAHASAPQTRSIRARFTGGVFVPNATVDLVDGSDVILDVRISPKNQ